MDFKNDYADPRRAAAYGELKYPDTYYLAFRDVPGLISKHVTGNRALDFGCGTGRSTRFLQEIGFDVVGIDIARDMLELAREKDPEGRYVLVEEGDLSQFASGNYDLVLSAFTFDNIPTLETKLTIFKGLRDLLSPTGKLINLVSSPDIYVNEWMSFSTKAYPENRRARSGDQVRIVNTAIADERPVVDIMWTDEAYREVYEHTGLEISEKLRPLGREDEPYEWVNETRIAPWVIYILQRLN